jgi:dual specificity phosphatase 12
MDGMSNMNEVIPNLWLGDLKSAQNTGKLREKNIHSILTAMRGKVVVAEVCSCLQSRTTIL